jgi:hypothetical protein
MLKLTFKLSTMQSIKLFKGLSAIAIALLCGACSSSDDDETARVRVVHLSPNAPAVNVKLQPVGARNNDDELRFDDLIYGESTGYGEVKTGNTNTEVFITQSGAEVKEQTKDLKENRFYTVLVSDFTTSLDLIFAEDPRLTPPSGSARVRAIHGAPSAPTVDIYVTAPEADLSGAPTLAGVPFQAVSDYLTIPGGDYRIRVTPANTKTVAIDSGSLNVPSGSVLSVIARDNVGGGAPFSFLVLDDRK